MLCHRCTACGGLNRVPSARRAEHPRCGRCKEPLDTSGAPQEVTAEELDRAVASSPVPVIVDFWAPWCGPCRMAAPLLDRLARERAGLVLVLKVDTDRHPGPSARLGVRGIPAFIAFRDGAEVGRQEGLPGAAAFARWIDGFAYAA